MHGPAHLEEVLVFLVAAVCIVPLFRWMKSSSVLGYLAAGVLVGPHALGLIKNPDSVLLLAELGVIFLLFTIGLELSLEQRDGHPAAGEAEDQGLVHEPGPVVPALP